MNQPSVKSMSVGLLLFMIVVVFVFISGSVYIIQEWEQAIITQFGKPVGTAVTKAGLHLKIPFIQKVRRIDKRILNWDGDPNRIPTKDKKYIHVDTTARWRIKDPLLLLQTVQSENGARRRMDGILDSVTRDTISSHNLVEAVRNTDAILITVKERLAKAKKDDGSGDEEEVTGEIEPVFIGREKLSAIIGERAAKELTQFGIELIDVQLRRIAYEASVEAKVYERMISERKRIAQKIRSIGLGKKAEILGKISRDLQGISSDAYRREQKIKGEAEAIAIAIYGEAMNADPEFYEFLRKLEACRKAIPAETKLILSTDSELLSILRNKQTSQPTGKSGVAH